MTSPPSRVPDPVPNSAPDSDAARFRRTLTKVMTVQVLTLLLLWWLQVTFTP